MAYQLLQPAINVGLDEQKFWDMTLIEIERYIQGAHWRMKVKAQYDYSLAGLIGIHTAKILSSEVTVPNIEEVYPNLFEATTVEDKPKEDLTAKSVNNFLARAMAINKAKKAHGGEQNK